METFSPYCDPSDNLAFWNLAFAGAIGLMVGFGYGRFVEVRLKRAARSTGMMLRASVLALPFLTALVVVYVYGSNPYFPGSAECGDTSEYMTIPLGNAVAMIPTTIIGLVISSFVSRTK